GPVRQALERCTFFSEPITFEVPKQFRRVSYNEMGKKDPMIAGVVRLHFIQLRPPLYSAMYDNTMINAFPTTNVRGAMQVTEGIDGYRFDVGRRRLGALRATTAPTPLQVRVAFDWSFESTIADELTDFKARGGNATLDLDGSAWKVVDASTSTRQ